MLASIALKRWEDKKAVSQRGEQKRADNLHMGKKAACFDSPTPKYRCTAVEIPFK
jgi:hypothetical protein